MLANMACSLIQNKRIFTTTAKAKALRVYVEPIITKSKDDTTHSRRIVFSYLKSKEAVSTLFKDVASKIAERNGGYTRIIKTGNRLGDAADMALIELVDFNDLYTSNKSTSTEKKSAEPKQEEEKQKKLLLKLMNQDLKLSQLNKEIKKGVFNSLFY